MTPYEQAKAIWSKEQCARTFDHDLSLHLLHGFVFSTPKYFIMGRPVDTRMPTCQIVHPECNWPLSQCDGWMVYAMSGDLSKVWDILPLPLPNVCFERNNELRFYSMDTLRRMCIPE